MGDAGDDDAGDGAVATDYDVLPGSSISTAVVQAIAEHEGIDPVELPPLHEAIDPDALDALFEGRTQTSDGTVTFTVREYQVTVHGRDRVTVTLASLDEKS